MKKFFVFVVAVCFVFSLAGFAMAVGPGKKIEYDEKTTGKVTFDGKVHAASKCKDCHPELFKMKKSDKLSKADMKAGKSCGACHDGKKAFDMKECTKCHKK